MKSSASRMPPFHYAFTVDDLDAAKAFYHGLLGLGVGRENDRWVDFDFHGHQITAHLGASAPNTASNPVDGREVPVPHFGLVLSWEAWEELAARLRAAETDFVIEPTIRFAGKPGEQATFFIRDPSGNTLEFKSFKDPKRLFDPRPFLEQTK